MDRIYVIYVILLVLVIYILIAVSIYLKYPFWCRQPVVHTYDVFRRWFTNSPKVIKSYKTLSKPTKYYMPDKTITFLPLDPDKSKYISLCTKLLQSHYIESDTVLFGIQESYMNAHFIGHATSTLAPLISFFYEYPGKDPTATISSIPIILHTRYSPDTAIHAYYWTFLCVNRGFQSSCLSRPLIQTHEYHQRELYPSADVSIFRRDTDLSKGIVPLTSGMSYTYYLRNGQSPVSASIHQVEQAGLQIIRIYPKSIEYSGMFIEYMSKLEKNCPFDFYMTASISHLYELMQSNILFVYAIVSLDTIVGLYWLKDVCTTYESVDSTPDKNNMYYGKTLHCTGSISSISDPTLFGHGFVCALYKLLKDTSNHYNMLLLDDGGSNSGILPVFHTYVSPINANVYAYYAYNWLIPGMPVESHKTLIFY